MLKKLISLVVVFICLSSFMYANASSARIVIVPKNFGYDTSDTLNKRESAIGSWKGGDVTGLFGGILHQTAITNPTPASMKFYISEAGNYKIYARVKDILGDVTPRKAYIQVDSIPRYTYCNTKSTGTALVWYWDAGPHTGETALNLQQGWHTLKVDNDSAMYSRVDVIVVMKAEDTFVLATVATDFNGEWDIISPVFSSGDVSITSDDTSVTLSNWPDATDVGGLVEYAVLRKIAGKYERIGDVPAGSAKTFTDIDLAEGTTYEYLVRAYDKFGQYDEKAVTIATTGTIDTEAPTWVDGGAISFSDIGYTKATASWTAAIDNKGVTSYNIYKGTQTNKIATVTDTTYHLTDLDSGVGTPIYIEAIDKRNNKSIMLSNSVTTLQSVNYIIKHENFTIKSGATWVLDNVDVVSGGDNILPVGKIFNNGMNGGNIESTATVYIASSGKYNLWVNVRDYATASPGTRYVQLSVDGVLDDYKLGAATIPIEGWSWYKGKEWNLTKGWHTLAVRGVGFSRFAAIHLTNELDKVLDKTSAYYTANLKKYEDVTAPSATGATINTALNSENSMNVSWNFPDISVKGVSISVDGVLKGIFDTNNCTIDNLHSLQKVNLSIDALDSYGNAAKFSKTLSVGNFDVTAFEIQNSTGLAITSLTGLSGNVKAVINEKNTSLESIDAVLSITVVDKISGRIVGNAKKDLTFIAGGILNDNVSIAVPASNYTVLASFWEKNTNKPLLSGIKLID